MKKQNKNVRILNPSKDIIITEEEAEVIQNLVEESDYFDGFCVCDNCEAIRNLLSKLKGEKVGKTTKRVENKR